MTSNTNEFIDSYEAGLLTDLLVKMKNGIGCQNIVRSRLDMTVHTAGGMRFDPHVDSPHPHVATIFYLNDSDGPTVINLDLSFMRYFFPFIFSISLGLTQLLSESL